MPAIVASGHAAVSRAGAELLRAGGNAFDACIGAGFASCVAEPALTSLGGGGFLLAHEANGRARLFDFFVDTPGRGRQNVGGDPHFVPITVQFTASEQVFNVGRGSIAVPGTLKGLIHVHERLGRLSLGEVVSPAIALAREGLRANPHQAYFLQILYPIMQLGEVSRALYTRGEAPIREGDPLRNPDLADFLEALHEDRGERFYHGDLAARIESEVGADGWLTAQDLAGYQVIERSPLEVPYRGHRLLTNPAPSFGGSLLGLSLSLLATQSLRDLAWDSTPYLSLLIALHIEVDRLRDAGCLSPAELAPHAAEQAAQPLRRAARGTTHVCVADAEGNVASMTTSNGEGSSVVIPGTGIMLNNMLGEDDLHPEGFHGAPPGQRVASMMSPSIVLRDGQPRIALGSGGSKRIRSAMLQVLTQVVDFERDLQRAVEAPRVHWDGEQVQVEPGFPKGVTDSLARRWPVNLWERIEVYFGGVQAVIPGQEGAADPRRGGAVERVD